MSVFWASINLVSLRKQRETLLGIFSTIYDVLMIIALIYGGVYQKYLHMLSRGML
jgi:hypothetical protein